MKFRSEVPARSKPPRDADSGAHALFLETSAVEGRTELNPEATRPLTKRAILHARKKRACRAQVGRLFGDRVLQSCHGAHPGHHRQDIQIRKGADLLPRLNAERRALLWKGHHAAVVEQAPGVGDAPSPLQRSASATGIAKNEGGAASHEAFATCGLRRCRAAPHHQDKTHHERGGPPWRRAPQVNANPWPALTRFSGHDYFPRSHPVDGKSVGFQRQEGDTVAVKIKRRVNKDDAPQTVEEMLDADQLQAATRDAFDYINEHRTPILAGLGGVLIAIVVGSFALDGYSQRNVPASDAVFGVMHTLAAEEGTPEDRAREARAGFSTAEAAHSGKRALQFGVWLDASAALLSGDVPAAQAGYSAMEGSSFTEAQLIAALGLAVAAADGGDLSGARSRLQALAERNASAAAVATLTEARLVDVHGEPAEALEAFRTVERRFPDAEGIDGVRSRIRQLEITLQASDAANDAG